MILFRETFDHYPINLIINIFNSINLYIFESKNLTSEKNFWYGKPIRVKHLLQKYLSLERPNDAKCYDVMMIVFYTSLSAQPNVMLKLIGNWVLGTVAGICYLIQELP